MVGQLVGYAIGALGILSVGALGGYKVGEFVGRAEIARVQVEKARVEVALAMQAQVLAEYAANYERSRADATADALVEVRRLTVQAAALQASLARSEAQRRISDAQRDAVLRAARTEDTAPISPAIRDWLASVRAGQLAADPDRPGAPGD